jgi:hypothetical protein
MSLNLINNISGDQKLPSFSEFVSTLYYTKDPREELDSKGINKKKRPLFARMEKESEEFLRARKRGRYHGILPAALAHYEKEGPFYPVDTRFIGRVDSVEGLLRTLLSRYPGICIGEAHNRPFGKDFLLRYLPLFVECGVNVFCLESFKDCYQRGLARLHTRGRVSKRIVNAIESFAEETTREFLKEILVKTYEQRIQILGIDTRKDLTGSHWRLLEGEECLRLKKMNYVGAQIINEYMKNAPEGSKFIAFMGGAHLDNHSVEVPGIAPQVGAPSIKIEGDKYLSAPSSFIVHNEVFYHFPLPVSVSNFAFY